MAGLAELSYQHTDRAASPAMLAIRANEWGYRHGMGTPKGEGWMGNIGTDEMPITEYTIQHRGQEIPTIIPNMSFSDVMNARKAAMTNSLPSQEVIRRAREFADKQWAKGQSQFKD
jgi:hypothetical protein